jgi:arylsulfatase A-like enzyme
MINRREFLGAGVAAATFGRAHAHSERPPNIVLILADDLGYGDVGCYGQQRIQTPNLDRMAAEGMRFTQAYAGSTVCAPSRCCLMTGLHTGHARTRGNQYPDLPLRPEDVTVAELLKRAGYRTGLFGKWSLGGLGSSGYPLKKGFDEWFGFFSQTHAHNSYPEHLLDNQTAYLLRGNFGAKKTEYAQDLFTDRALRFLKSQDDRPFFLHLCYTTPHANNELGRDTGDGMEVPTLEPYEAVDWPRQEKAFAAMITRMDRDIGRVFEQLRAAGQERRTLVLFSSDNGPHNEGGHSAAFFSSTGPLRGIKRSLYEGGIRVPTLAWWPGRVPAGRTSDDVWAFWEFLPTACELAGVTAPRGLDGRSIAPILMGHGRQAPDYLYWEFHERVFAQAVRMGDWKGVRTSAGAALELYNLTDDLGETRNVAGEHADIVRDIERIMRTARTESAEWPVRS